MFDFKITEKGELIYNNTVQNVDISDNDILTRQIAVNRIKSVTNDWFNEKIGADIEKYIGLPNNNETVKDILSSIRYTLTFDDFLLDSDIYFIPRLDKTTISIKVFIKKRFEYAPIIIDVEIDIVGGVKIEYDINS